MTVVLGYNGGLDGYPGSMGSSHDSAAALVIDGVVVAAVEEERLSRVKHTGAFPRGAIDYVLRAGGVRLEEVDLVAYYFSFPHMFDVEMYRQNRDRMRAAERASLWTSVRFMQLYNELAGYGDDDRNRRAFERAMNVKLTDDRYRAIPHHVCHTASTYYDSPFDHALCLTLDAQGESASSLAIHARGTDLRLLRETMSPNSLGYLYGFVSSFLGFGRHDDYKVMGLAPYGDPAPHRAWFTRHVGNDSDGNFQVEPNLMGYLIARDGLFGQARMYPRAMTVGLGPARRSGEPVLQRHMDIAASLQEALERVVLCNLAALQRQTGETNLCMAGGVALNCTMNGRIARSGLFDKIWIHPAAHDAGTSVGAALYGYHNVLGRPRRAAPSSHAKHFYLGPEHPAASVESALEEFGHAVSHRRPADLYRTVAAALAEGKVVGWYQGRMEWGPRALGNRSILADGRRDDMKDIVNHAVKMREGFRPFAPACLAEHADEWFDMQGLDDSPYMLFTVPVREAKRRQLPAVTHVDGSARVQTVTAVQNARLHRLLSTFHELTGVPVLMNTSFNVKDEPIVNTPADAIRCFLNTHIDVLVLHDVVLEKSVEVVAAIRARRAQPVETGRVVDGRIAAL